MNIRYLWLVMIPALLGCDNDEGPKIKAENEVNEFVWEGLNSWYFWQSEVEDLSDDRFGSKSKRNEFLNTFSSPDELFYQLNHPDDDFSWIVDDYEELESSFQGTSKSFGYEFGLLKINETDIIGYVQYVYTNGPARDAGVERGDIFYEVNGTQLTVDNYIDLLFSNETYTLSLAQFENDGLTPTDEEISLSAITLTENPVHFSKILEIDGVRIGYLVYNNFRYNFHQELNAAMRTLSEGNIDEMVLDLRYNSGGSVTTTTILAGMLYRNAGNTDVLARLLFNTKKEEENETYFFQTEVPLFDDEGNFLDVETMSRLDIPRLYVLVSDISASASEVLIAGLGPYMEVTIVGTTTRGKNEASVTLYDAPKSDFRNRAEANPNHRWAMQPIIAKVANAQNFYEYGDGFTPDIEVDEIEFFGEIKPFGDPEEHLLQAAINDILGLPQTSRVDRAGVNVKSIFNSSLKGRFSDELYIIPGGID